MAVQFFFFMVSGDMVECALRLARAKMSRQRSYNRLKFESTKRIMQCVLSRRRRTGGGRP